MMRGLNIAYGEIDNRSFLTRSGLAVIFTLGASLMMLISLLVIIGVPSLLTVL